MLFFFSLCNKGGVDHQSYWEMPKPEYAYENYVIISGLGTSQSWKFIPKTDLIKNYT